MNSINKVCFVCLLLLIIFCTGCQRTYDYSFAQSIDNIEKVEIHAYDDETQTSTLIVELDDLTGKTLLAEIDALKCKRHFGDSTMAYGEVIIYISYYDQTAEVIGLWNVAQVDTDGKWHIGVSYFDATQMCTLIMDYVDADLLPDLRHYFEE